MSLLLCNLCSQQAQYPIKDNDLTFCCPGCHAVFNILSAKNGLANFETNPLFLQAVRSGLISNPALLEQIRRNQPAIPFDEREKLHLEITEMWCPSCAEIIKLILLQQNGVIDCIVDYSTDLASIEFTPRHISKERIFQLIKSLGYQPASLEDPNRKAVSFSLYMRFVISAFCALNIMMFSYPIYASYFDGDSTGYAHIFSWLSLAASLPVLTYSGFPIFRKFLLSLRLGLFGMESLVVIGVLASFGLSLYELLNGGDWVYFDSMSIIITFVLLGKIIEARAKFSTKETLLRLNRALPRRGRKRKPNGELGFVSLKEMQKGDVLCAFTGEKIVLDGIVIEGEGATDESLMTGEAWPVPKRAGSQVLAGSIIQQGSLFFQVTRSPEETALNKIIETLEKDLNHKTNYVRSADLIVRWFVPVVLLAAILTALFCFMFNVADVNKTLFQTAIIRAISVLLISCPCAIGIAAPLAESYLMNGLARLGAIVRNRGCLALLGKETSFVFDKTGTITEGKFTVQGGLENLLECEKMVLKAMVAQSIHPIAVSVSQTVEESAAPIDRFEESVGKGLRCFAGEDRYLLGSEKFLEQSGVQVNATSSDTMHTQVYFAKNHQQLAKIVLSDRLRPGAQELVKSLSNTKTLLLSGDSRASVQTIAKLCGFSDWQAQCNPFEKREKIIELRKSGEVVCMFGDGINDSLALSEAQIAISVVSATDISIQVSDILLTSDRLEIIPKIRALATKGQKIVKQNLFWAFFYNVIGIPLAMAGILSPIFAAFAMVASSLIVLFNAKRLLRVD